MSNLEHLEETPAEERPQWQTESVPAHNSGEDPILNNRLHKPEDQNENTNQGARRLPIKGKPSKRVDFERKMVKDK